MSSLKSSSPPEVTIDEQLSADSVPAKSRVSVRRNKTFPVICSYSLVGRNLNFKKTDRSIITLLESPLNRELLRNPRRITCTCVLLIIVLRIT